MTWIDFNIEKPSNRQRILVLFTNAYGINRISIAEYIEPQKVLAENFLDSEHGGDFEEYDEKQDCFWTPTGFYESQFATDINFFLDEKIDFWMPLPKLPKVTCKKHDWVETVKPPGNRSGWHEKQCTHCQVTIGYDTSD